MRRVLPAVVVVVVVVAAGCGGRSTPPPFKVVSATSDIEITACDVSTSGLPVAELRITNHTSATADYVTVVDFTVGTMTRALPGFERGVPSHRSIAASVTGATRVAGGAHLSCAVGSVRRSPTTGTPVSS